ncbi:probable cytochrome P450 6a20 [Chironomus tepperi]|uniref:probable cytochrome P450 6a20 n=1 Tax=Chironomus tepperi TaxID=113505 RepID=UPI00391F18F2
MLLLTLAILFTSIYFYIKNYYSFFEKHGFPCVTPTFPLGSFKNVGRTEHISEFLRREYDNFKDKGPAFGVFQIFRKTLVVTDLDAIKDILVKRFDIFYSHGMDFGFSKDTLFHGIFFVDGTKWKNMRSIMTPMFSSSRIKSMFPTISKQSDRMIEYLKTFSENKDSCEMNSVYAGYTTELIGNVAFGLNIECLGKPDNEFYNAASTFLNPTTFGKMKTLTMICFPKLANMLGLTVTSKKTKEFFEGAVRDNMEYREKNNIDRNDLFQQMINSKNGMTFAELVANCFIFFIAGYETSSSTLTFCSYELAMNQHVQDRLREEILEVLEKHNGEVTYDAIMEMKYLEMVFLETLRKYPIIEAQTRRAAKDYQIPNSKLVIPAGTVVLVPTIGFNYDERYHNDPDTFDPERFSEENVKARENFVFLPFSEGPRFCLGLRFGPMQTKIALVKLLKNFIIKPCNKTAFKMSPSSHLQSPVGGMWLKVEKIS